MTKPTETLVEFPRQSARDVLTEVLRTGARQLLATAIEAEVDEYVAVRAKTVDAAGRRGVVRNGHLPKRALQTPLGDVTVQQPRVRDRRPDDERETFRSAILPPYLRKTPSLEALYPWLYLKGLSTGDFGEALQALLGVDAQGLSATTITRLKTVWEQEYHGWSKRALAGRRYVYVWADGVYFNVRLEDTDNKRQCILVLIGATREGTKELSRDHGRLSRERAVVARAATGCPGPRAHDRSRSSHRRRRSRLLGRGAEGVPEDPRTAVLGPQDGQRPEQTPQGRAGQGESHAPRHLDGGDAEVGRAGIRPLRDDVYCEVPGRDHLSRQGPRRPAHLLHVSGRALDAHPHHESDRVDVRHRAVTHEEDEGRGQSAGLLNDGLQAGSGRAETMENIERGSVDRRGHQWRALRRWHQKGSRLS